MRAVSFGLFVSDADDCPDALGLAEDDVHLFKGPVCCFRIKEVDDWKDYCAVTAVKVSFNVLLEEIRGCHT